MDTLESFLSTAISSPHARLRRWNRGIQAAAPPVTVTREIGRGPGAGGPCHTRSRRGRVAISYADLGVEELGAVYERVIGFDDSNDIGEARSVGGTAPCVRTPARSTRRKRWPTLWSSACARTTPLRAGPLTGSSTFIVDHAMGSGAFLSPRCDISRQRMSRALIRDGRCDASDISDTERTSFRRLIAHQCLLAWTRTRSQCRWRACRYGSPRWRTPNQSAFSITGFEWQQPDRGVTGDIHRSPGATTRDRRLTRARRAWAMLRRVVPTLLEISREPADSVADVRRKEAAWSSLQNDAHPLARWKDAVSLWCAQWFWPAGERRPSPRNSCRRQSAR